jgi:nicotinate dehydrogenase subunit B
MSMLATSRRGFFGVVVGFSIADPAIAPRAVADTVKPPASDRLDSWIRIGRDGGVTVFTDKVDIGMGLQTALSQIVAEELDVSPRRVSFVMGDTAMTPDQGGVGGSTSISNGARPLRNAAATARALLVELAAQRLGAPAGELTVADGVVIGGGKSVSYGELIRDHALNGALRVSGRGFNVNVEGQGKPKDPSQYKVVGKPLPRAELAAKILGTAVYSTDVRVPGMLHGRVMRPPAAGAKIESVDDSAAKKIPGFVRTVVKGNFAGVVAENEWAAIRAAKAVNITWSKPAADLPADVFAHLRATAPKASRPGLSRGDANALASAARKIQASYEWPFQAHATMGPGCAVADVRADGVTTVWCGSQKNHALQKGIADLLRVLPDRVRCIWMPDAGSYGRAGYEDTAADAVVLSQETGKPVRVQWMRADMTAWGSKGPAAVIDLAAGFDTAGNVSAFRFESRCFSGSEVLYLADAAGNFLAARLMGFPNTSAGTEFCNFGDCCPVYEFPNLQSVAHVAPAFDDPASPLAATHLRDPNGPQGTFAMESFIDEMAAAAGTDPVEFRLKYTKDPRAKAVITAAAERAGWKPRKSPGGDAGEVSRGRGIAYAVRGGTYVATVAEVEVNRRTGAVRVTRMVCAHDCGLIVNPDGLRGVVCANLIQSLGRALKEEVLFDRERVTSVDWNTYRVARAGDVPEHVELVLLNHPELPPGGAGEPSSRPTAAAIGNAIFDAVGARLRRVPMNPERVKAALARV